MEKEPSWREDKNLVGADEVGFKWLYLNKSMNLLYTGLFIVIAFVGSPIERVVASVLAGLLAVVLLHRIMEKLNRIDYYHRMYLRELHTVLVLAQSDTSMGKVLAGLKSLEGLSSEALTKVAELRNVQEQAQSAGGAAAGGT